MVSGKPPRRSKSPDEPVTIDLTAAETTAAPEETTAAIDPARQMDANSGTPDGEMRSSEAPAYPGLDQNHSQTTESEATATDASRTDGIPSESRQEASASTNLQSPSSSAMIASGIAGGLVALVLAGSMQYAGVLPGMGGEPPVAAAEIDNTELDALKGEVARLAAMPAPQSIDPTLADRIAALETSSAAQPTSPAVDPVELEQIRTQLAAANEAIAALRSQIASNSDALNQSATRLAEAERKLEEPRSDVEMARAIALSGLKTALDRGGPFLSELEALKSVSPEDPAIAPLSRIAGAGLPSRSDIARNFAEVADDILAAINQPAAGETWTDRLMASARSLIKVRPVGNVEGETPEAIVARVENKLQNGDLKGAALEWETLPDAGKAASDAFAKTLKDRVEAEALVTAALSKTVAGNGG